MLDPAANSVVLAVVAAWLSPWISEPPLHHVKVTSPVLCADFSPDGKILALGCADGSIWTGFPADGTFRLFSRLPKGIPSLAFSRDGNKLAVSCFDGSIRFIEVTTAKEHGVIERAHERYASCLVYHPDGTVLASGGEDSFICLWDKSTGKLRSRFPIHLRDKGGGGEILCLAISSNGRRLASISQANALTLSELTTGRRLFQAVASAEYKSMSFSPDGRTVAGIERPGRIVCIRETATNSQRIRLECSSVLSRIAFSPCGKTLATVDYDNHLRLWDATTAKEVRKIAFRGFSLGSVAFSPDGQFLALISYDNCAFVWRAPNSSKGTPRRTKLDAKHIQEHFLRLAEEDGERAFHSIRALAAAENALSSLAQPFDKLRVRYKQIHQLLKELDSDQYTIREKAANGLVSFGSQALPLLRDVLERPGTLEVKQRVQRIVGRLEPTHSPDHLFWLRAIEVVELTATNEARGFLEHMGRELSGELALEASAALARLAKPQTQKQ